MEILVYRIETFDVDHHGMNKRRLFVVATNPTWLVCHELLLDGSVFLLNICG